MSTVVRNPSEESIKPAVHLEFIRNQAALTTEQQPATDEIAEYHRSLFMHHHALEIERLKQEGLSHEERLGFLHSRWNEIQERLKGLEKFVPVAYEGQPDVRPSAPWNMWDRLMFGGALAAIISLLIFGILNISFNLLESGLVTFMENPYRAYFWAALLPVGAFAVKVGWDLLPDGSWRAVYLWVCLALGMAGVLVWMGTYSTVYPTLSKSITDQLTNVSVFDDSSSAGQFNPGGARSVDMVMVFAQAIAEIFLSAVLGMFMTLIYSRHRPVQLATDPVFARLDEERVRLEREMVDARMGLAAARGREKQYENQLSALATYAKSIYQKEVAVRKEQSSQKEAVLDRITQHVRTQLETISSGDYQPRPASLPLEGSNGR
jgi:hypothetical protein